MFWGYTPALDLNKELDLSTSNETVNILLVGTADGRHVIKTLSEAYKHPNIKYNFYIIETWIEQIARQILLLNIILEPDTSLGLFEKVRIFMELYGNTIIRPSVSRYLYKKSAELVEAITDSTYLAKIMPIFNFDQLKFKERDYMENVFKFWKKPDTQFDIKTAWDYRVRKALGQRYDYRNGVFDWDYHMRLCELDAKIIFSREYINWRESGIAFTWLETDGSKPNLTYGAGILGNGLNLYHHGYLGDIVIGPHIAYGIECENEKMFEQSNREFKKRSTDVTEYNLVHIFHQICHQKPYTNQFITLGTEQNCAYIIYPDIKTDLYEDFEPNKYDPNNAIPLLPLKNVTVTFLSKTSLSIIHQKEKYQDYFDLIIFGNDQLDNIFKDLFIIGKNCTKILFETRKFMIQFNRDDIRQYGEKILEKANECELVLLNEFDPAKDTYARFHKQNVKKKTYC